MEYKFWLPISQEPAICRCIDPGEWTLHRSVVFEHLFYYYLPIYDIAILFPQKLYYWAVINVMLIVSFEAFQEFQVHGVLNQWNRHFKMCVKCVLYTTGLRYVLKP
jgi:hypothetical protein